MARRARLKARNRHFGKILKYIPPPPLFPKGPPRKRDYNLELPAILDFHLNLEPTLTFFRNLNRLIFRKRATTIRIDHSTLKQISPDAALVLIAELYRGSKLFPRCKMRGSPAGTPEAHEMLGQIGYWDYYKGMDWSDSKSSTKIYVKHRYGDLTKGTLVRDLIQLFLPESDAAKSKLLYRAVIECMDNVMKHAYAPALPETVLKNHWWLLGYRDSHAHEISFCFYDQGVGIPRTIRTRLKDQFGPLSATDAELIVKAVVEGHYSSTKDPTRGRGLPTLKHFIDEAKTGHLMIVSFKSRCIFTRDDTKKRDLKKKFGGTLIAWTLQK